MAVAKAQYATSELEITSLLWEKGVNVCGFAIHPIAGRMHARPVQRPTRRSIAVLRRFSDAA